MKHLVCKRKEQKELYPQQKPAYQLFGPLYEIDCPEKNLDALGLIKIPQYEWVTEKVTAVWNSIGFEMEITMKKFDPTVFIKCLDTVGTWNGITVQEGVQFETPPLLAFDDFNIEFSQYHYTTVRYNNGNFVILDLFLWLQENGPGDKVLIITFLNDVTFQDEIKNSFIAAAGKRDYFKEDTP